MKLIQQHSQRFEQVAKTLSLKSNFIAGWRSVCQSIAANQEPQVWQRRDRDGNFGWYAYDPISQRSLHYATEDEVRLWLDQLPYYNDGYYNDGGRR
ncbi:hypothetical protein [Phormidesmis priestleyi]